MKFVVDKLPNKPSECPFISALESCNISRDKIKCNIGKDGFTCHHLREFNAVAEKYHYVGDSCTGVTRLNVRLEEKY